jgi:RNA polymerase sigma-70 factor, ECF subfamily
MRQPSETVKSQELIVSGLLRKVFSGDVEAYGKLYDLCFHRIYSYVFNMVGNTMLAEDITEEVFIKAWKAIKSCQGKEGTFVPWLYRIAHNHTVDVLRKNTNHIPLDSVDPGSLNPSDAENPVELAEAAMERQRIMKVISTLPEQQKQILILKFLNGADNNEIEKITGKNQGAIRVLQMRALLNLKQQLKSQESSDDR